VAPVEDEKPPTLGPSKKDSIGKTDFEQALAAATRAIVDSKGKTFRCSGSTAPSRASLPRLTARFNGKPFVAFPILR